MNRLKSFAVSALLSLAVCQPTVGHAQKLSDLNNSDVVEPEVTKVGDWNLICEPGGSPCAMTQLGNDPNGSPAIEFVVRKVDDEEAKINGVPVIAVADIITPLGVLLEFGVRMKIDAQKERAAPFRICQQHGCLVREPLSDEVLESMRKGNKATITVAADGAGPVEIEISLKGFTKAFRSL